MKPELESPSTVVFWVLFKVSSFEVLLFEVSLFGVFLLTDKKRKYRKTTNNGLL